MPFRPLRVLAALLIGLAGCGEELGPVRPPTTRVAGRLRVGDRPVGSGFLELIPVEGTVGNLRSSPIGPDGSFEVRGVALGTYAVRVVDPPFALPAPSTDRRIAFDQFTTPIRREVAEGGAPLEIDLEVEVARHVRDLARSRAGVLP